MTEDRPDRRVTRTRRALREALIGLILEKGYDAVTVGDIADRADVGRSTFYAHFVDKDALLLGGFPALPVFWADGAVDRAPTEVRHSSSSACPCFATLTTNDDSSGRLSGKEVAPSSSARSIGC